MADRVLLWQGLSVRYAGLEPGSPEIEAVRDLSFELSAGECLAIVGESGSGKTQSMLAPFGLAPGAGLEGRAWLGEVDLVSAAEPERNALRGKRAGFVFQDPLTSLAPHLTVGDQITEGLRFHLGMTRAAAERRALALLDQVQLTDPARRLKQFPHELSGGMRQRVMIAMALACEPALLVADEPTTALDATVQAEVLALLRRLQRDLGLAMVFISHDLGAVSRVADQVLVMRRGSMVEHGPARRVLAQPEHAYTAGLARAARRAPLVQQPAPTAADHAEAVIACASVSVSFSSSRASWWRRGGRPVIQAAEDVSFQLRRGCALGIVGESGSGKSTVLRAAVGLQRCSGVVRWSGTALGRPGRLPLAQRLDVQMVFQDALASFDPSMSVGASVAMAVRQRHPSWHADQVQVRVAALLEACGLEPAFARRHPTQLSGGQNQRAAISRALGAEPRVLACDEAVSALDVSVRNQVLELLLQLKRDMGLAILFVTHDMAVVRRLCDEVVVLRHGKVVESGGVHQVLLSPRTDYTRALLDAVLELPAQEGA